MRSSVKTILSITALLIVAVSIEIGGGIYIHWLFEGDWEKASKFGESFGAINALLSSLALIGVVYASFLQKATLDQLRGEAAHTRQIDEELSKDRQKTSETFSSQVMELSRAAEIQAISLRLRFLDEEYKAAIDKQAVIAEKRRLNERIRMLVDS